MMKLLVILSLAALASAQRADIEYTLFTKDNTRTPQILTLNDASSVANSNFLSSRKTRCVTHGWRGDDQTISVAIVRDAYLAAGDDNVIVINWNRVQSILQTPRTTASIAGQAIAQFLNFLQESAGLDFSTTTLVGHSLGAHALGIAARLADGTIDSVVALDPAGTDTWETEAEGILLGVQSGDASHVQVIHTNGGGMGLTRATGDSDFYVNGGSSQPGCLVDVAGICAHFRATSYFAESIENPTGFRSTENSNVFLGGHILSKHARGSYTLNTNRSPPFARG